MKRKVIYTTKFKKDLKRYRSYPQKRAKIVEVVEMLANGVEIPTSMRPHHLFGNYVGYMELHIEGDLLLIWIERKENGEEEIHLVRLGSHSELFK